MPLQNYRQTRTTSLVTVQHRRGESPASFLAQEHGRWQEFYQAQPPLIQRFLDAQAQALADALIQPASQARFALPERVVLSISREGKAGSLATISIRDARAAGGRIDGAIVARSPLGLRCASGWMSWKHPRTQAFPLVRECCVMPLRPQWFMIAFHPAGR